MAVTWSRVFMQTAAMLILMTVAILAGSEQREINSPVRCFLLGVPVGGDYDRCRIKAV